MDCENNDVRLVNYKSCLRSVSASEKSLKSYKSGDQIINIFAESAQNSSFYDENYTRKEAEKKLDRLIVEAKKKRKTLIETITDKIRFELGDDFYNDENPKNNRLFEMRDVLDGCVDPFSFRLKATKNCWKKLIRLKKLNMHIADKQYYKWVMN